MSYMGDNMFTARSRHVMALLLGFTVITSVTALKDKNALHRRSLREAATLSLADFVPPASTTSSPALTTSTFTSQPTPPSPPPSPPRARLMHRFSPLSSSPKRAASALAGTPAPPPPDIIKQSVEGIRDQVNSVITTFGTELKTYVDLFNRATGQSWFNPIATGLSAVIDQGASFFTGAVNMIASLAGSILGFLNQVPGVGR